MAPYGLYCAEVKTALSEVTSSIEILSSGFSWYGKSDCKTLSALSFVPAKKKFRVLVQPVPFEKVDHGDVFNSYIFLACIFYQDMYYFHCFFLIGRIGDNFIFEAYFNIRRTARKCQKTITKTRPEILTAPKALIKVFRYFGIGSCIALLR